MAESVSVRCPACHRWHSFSPPTYPCPCGAPLAVPMLREGVPLRLERPTWAGSWVAVRCPACERVDQWPRPELGCTCGVVLRLPVRPDASDEAARDGEPTDGRAEAAGGTGLRRPAFQPVTIRTSQDAVTAAGMYLMWLGFAGVRRSTERRPSVDVRGDALVAQVDPSTHPSGRRELECLWLYGLQATATPVFFSLAGYTPEARACADELRLPLFVLDLTGTPQPLNDAADDLVEHGPDRTAEE